MRVKFPLRLADGQRVTQIIVEFVYDRVAADAPVELAVTIGERTRVEEIAATRLLRECAQDGDLLLMLERLQPARMPAPKKAVPTPVPSPEPEPWESIEDMLAQLERSLFPDR